MNNQIFITLKKKLEEITTSNNEISIEAQRNAVKETLQYYALNFIYHHPIYSNWIMYGGSALRICHDLDRMSVDLDFEVESIVTNEFLEKLKEELSTHFKNTYAIDVGSLTISITNNRGLTLKFHIAEELYLPFHSRQVHVKIDLNHFKIHPKIVTERWPQNEYQLSFVINTYNMSALMASKIAAIFLRGQRGVGKKIYEEKGRDIYDLLWYMGKKIIPDLDYLNAKNVGEAKDLRTLFDKLTLKMNGVSDENLKNDLTPLFVNQHYIENWLKNWRELYMRHLEKYEIHTITELEEIIVDQDFYSDNYSFIYSYYTEDNYLVKIIYNLGKNWIMSQEEDLEIEKDVNLKDKITFSGLRRNSKGKLEEKIEQYANLFHQKTKKYLEKTSHIILGDMITTKLIRTTADNLNQTEQILLNKSTLIHCELDDLLK